MRNRIHPTLAEAVGDPAARLAELKRLDWYDFNRELIEALEAIYFPSCAKTNPRRFLTTSSGLGFTCPPRLRRVLPSEDSPSLREFSGRFAGEMTRSR